MERKWLLVASHLQFPVMSGMPQDSVMVFLSFLLDVCDARLDVSRPSLYLICKAPITTYTQLLSLPKGYQQYPWQKNPPNLNPTKCKAMIVVKGKLFNHKTLIERYFHSVAIWTPSSA